MTDLAFIVDTSDAALPAGRAVAAVSNDSTGAESFSGLLSERMQSGLARPPQKNDSSPAAMTSDVNADPKSGVVEPVDGKPLPLLPSQDATPSQDLPQTGFADAALLAAISQSTPGDLTPTTSPGDVDLPANEIESETGLAHPADLSGSLLSNGLFNTLGEVVPVARVDASTTQAKMSTQLEKQLPTANLATHLLSAQSNGLSAEKQDQRSDNSRVVATGITPALLAQPISESAQRALVMAMKDAGLTKRVAPSIASQTESTQTLNSRQTGLSPLANGLTAAMQMASATGRLASKAGIETVSVNAHLPQQPASSLASVTPLAMTSSASDVSGLLSAGPSLSTTAGTGFMPTMSVATPIGQAGWSNELGQRVAWLAQGELREAQLQLNPRNLGPVEVRITYGHEQQLNVSFTAANPLAREALDAALPRLREMFEQQGLNLADADISQHSFSDQRDQGSEEDKSNSRSGNWSSDVEELTEHAMLSHRLLMGDGMLDAYA